MEKLFYTLFCFLYIVSDAQVKQYNATLLNEYLNKTTGETVSLLYYAAVDGKIRAYKSDSLNSYYQTNAVKTVGMVSRSEKKNGYSASTEAVDVTFFDPAKDNRGICAFYKMSGNLNNVQQSFALSSLAVMYEPHSGDRDFTTPIQPLFYFKMEDVLNVLPPNNYHLAVQLSNILLSDKRWGNYYNAATQRIKIPFEELFANGTNNNFLKYAFLNKDALEAVSLNVYSLTVQLMLADLRKQVTAYYDDNTLSRQLSGPGLTIFTLSAIISENEDTAHYTTVDEESVNSILWDTKSFGILLRNKESSTAFCKREDFERLVPPWLSVFLYENF